MVLPSPVLGTSTKRPRPESCFDLSLVHLFRLSSFTVRQICLFILPKITVDVVKPRSEALSRSSLLAVTGKVVSVLSQTQFTRTEGGRNNEGIDFFDRGLALDGIADRSGTCFSAAWRNCWIDTPRSSTNCFYARTNAYFGDNRTNPVTSRDNCGNNPYSGSIHTTFVQRRNSCWSGCSFPRSAT
jgi:hypothetical protein